ncbi:MAG TPA: hypothetical protein VFS10_13675 [Pyrinomonadaceae bacterium]|nr:hypothetical protein [Pyrinomonadaceae bacterium]
MSTDRTTEILHYLSAMSRDIGEFRTETRTQIGELRTEMRTGFDELRKEVRVLTNRLNRLEARLLVTYTDVDELDMRVTALEGKQE